jgi:hypothetical protein
LPWFFLKCEHLCVLTPVVELPRMQAEQSKFPPPPGMIASLVRGFDSVTTHLAVILPPVALDLFLWLGPHLRLQKFLQPIINLIPNLPFPTTPAPSDIEALQQNLADFASRFNLFSFLRTFPVGITSLLGWSLSDITSTPLHQAQMLDAGSIFGVAGWILLLILLGLFLGGYYYYWVSGAAIKRDKDIRAGKAILQSFVIFLIWSLILLVLGLPILTVISVLIQIIPTFFVQVLAMVVVAILAWLALPFFFSAHGIYTYKMNALNAFVSSLQMVRYTLPNTGLFLLAVLIINEGLNFLWKTPSQGSWWMLVGIAGHAFISTALLAASFIYFRDTNDWLKIVLEMLKERQVNTNSMKA